MVRTGSRRYSVPVPPSSLSSLPSVKLNCRSAFGLRVEGHSHGQLVASAQVQQLAFEIAALLHATSRVTAWVCRRWPHHIFGSMTAESPGLMKCINSCFCSRDNFSTAFSRKSEYLLDYEIHS